MNGRLLFDLPTSLSACIISEWLSLKDRVRLDSAHCQASVREEFLKLTRRPELSVKSWVENQTHLINRALVTWALLREVYVEKLSVKRESDVDVYNSYLHRFASRVFVLCLNCSRTNSLVESTAICLNLLVLKVHNCKLSATLRDVFVCCKRLREFRSRSCIYRHYSTDSEQSDPPLTSVHLETIVCNNLKYLELEECDVDLVAAFLRMAAAVEVVVLTTNDVSLNGIAVNMSSTASTLSLTGIAFDASLANFAPQGEQFESLCLPYCYVTDTAISALSKFPKLRALDLTYAFFETENHLSLLARCCGEGLTELLLYNCRPTLSLVQLQQVFPQFMQLESFSCRLTYDPFVWDMSVFNKLTKLSLCYDGDDNAQLVSQLTENCHSEIRELSLRMVESDRAAEQLNILVSRCLKLRSLNLQDRWCMKEWYRKEEKARWKSLRSDLVVGSNCKHRLNVFQKYECSSAW